MLKFLKVCAYPISLLYGVIMLVRNKLFDWHILPSEAFKVPVICVGNLVVGGTGKTPHIEYLIRLLAGTYKIAVLSRGYKRETKGFICVREGMDAKHVGDEVVQLYNKFENIIVAVCENRRKGIKEILKHNAEVEVILLDDAFQHRYVKPGISMLLTDYSQLYLNDFVLPTGNLREFILGANRADIICVTKSPKVLSPIVSKDIEEKLKLKAHQSLYFSYIKYENFVPLYKENMVDMPNKVYAIFMFAGIVNTYPLEEFLKTKCDELEVLNYPDHYKYTEKDVACIIKKFKDLYTVNKIIVTTEKDAKRLENEVFRAHFKNIPIFYIPIEVEFHNKYKQHIDNQILSYVKKNKPNS